MIRLRSRIVLLCHLKEKLSPRTPAVSRWEHATDRNPVMVSIRVERAGEGAKLVTHELDPQSAGAFIPAGKGPLSKRKIPQSDYRK